MIDWKWLFHQIHVQINIYIISTSSIPLYHHFTHELSHNNTHQEMVNGMCLIIIIKLNSKQIQHGATIREMSN
jgi:hypothetical protein